MLRVVLFKPFLRQAVKLEHRPAVLDVCTQRVEHHILVALMPDKCAAVSEVQTGIPADLLDLVSADQNVVIAFVVLCVVIPGIQSLRDDLRQGLC